MCFGLRLGLDGCIAVTETLYVARYWILGFAALDVRLSPSQQHLVTEKIQHILCM